MATDNRPRQQGGASLASYRFGGRTYPFRTVASCLTCQSPYRLEIEEMIAKGVPYSRIVTDLDLTAGRNRVTARSMIAHFNNGHMPVESESVRRILERRAVERGQSIEEGVAAIVDGHGFAEIVLEASVQRLASGEIAPTVQDGLNAAKLLETLRPVADGNNESDYLIAFTEYHSTAQQIMTESQFQEFGRLLSANPTLKALLARYNGEEEESEEGDFYEQGTVVVGELTQLPQESATE